MNNSVNNNVNDDVSDDTNTDADAAELPESARPVWQSYRAMAQSKDRHLHYLQHLEQKYQRYGRPNDDEQRRLAELLAAHDARVGEFRGGLGRLKISDPTGFAAVLMRLSADAES